MAAGAAAIAAGAVQATADAAHDAIKKVEPDAHEVLTSLAQQAIKAKGETGALVEQIMRLGLEVKKTNQEIANAGAERGAKGAKDVLEAQLANIEAWKAAQHAAYEAGKIDVAAWRVAEVQASDAAAIAHEDYLNRIIGIYLRAGEVEKAHAAAQELATLRTKDAAKETETLAAAMEKHREATRKVVEEYAHLVDAGVEKDFVATAKATEQLTKAEDELLKAQSKLAESKLSDRFRDQEDAIRKLAAMHLITEEQKDDRLKLLEQQQANAAIQILANQLAKEKALVDAAAARLASVKVSISVSPAQVIEAEANLKKLETAVTNTEAQIVATKEKFNKQSEADDKSHYGRALLMAIAAGDEILAEQLKQNHANLLAAEHELALAKARGADTTAIQHKITALKEHEQVLEKEAGGNQKLLAAQLQVTKAQLLATQSILADAKARGMDTTAIEKQIADLKKLEAELTKTKQGTQNLELATDKLKQSTKDAATQMLSSLSSAFAGIITGQQSFGKAMEEATLKMIGSMAAHWGEYFAAKGIADIWDDPPLGGAELAAAAALFAISGAMSGLASNAAKPGTSAGTQQGPTPGQSSSSGGGSNQTVGVTHLAAGGLVSTPTLFIAGDSASGGGAEEAVIPLSNPQALARIANALLSVPTLRAASRGMASSAAMASASGSGPAPARFAEPTRSQSEWPSEGLGDTHVHINFPHGTLVSPDNLAKVAKKINRMVANRQITLKASDSLRLTRRSQ